MSAVPVKKGGKQTSALGLRHWCRRLQRVFVGTAEAPGALRQRQASLKTSTAVPRLQRSIATHLLAFRMAPLYGTRPVSSSLAHTCLGAGSWQTNASEPSGLPARQFREQGRSASRAAPHEAPPPLEGAGRELQGGLKRKCQSGDWWLESEGWRSVGAERDVSPRRGASPRVHAGAQVPQQLL